MNKIILTRFPPSILVVVMILKNRIGECLSCLLDAMDVGTIELEALSLSVSDKDCNQENQMGKT